MRIHNTTPVHVPATLPVNLSCWEVDFGITTTPEGRVSQWVNRNTGSAATQTDPAKMPTLKNAHGRDYVEFQPGQFLEVNLIRTFNMAHQFSMGVAFHSSSDTAWKYRNMRFLNFNPGWQGVPTAGVTGSTGNGFQFRAGGDASGGGVNAAINAPDLIAQTGPEFFLGTWQTTSANNLGARSDIIIYRNGVKQVFTDAASTGRMTTEPVKKLIMFNPVDPANSFTCGVTGFYLFDTFATDAESRAIFNHAKRLLPPITTHRIAPPPPVKVEPIP